MKRRLLSGSSIALLALAAGCTSNDGYDAYPVDPGPSVPNNVLRMAIDTDQTLVAKPGDGAGLFVEYAAGGDYHVFSTCDTNSSDFVCHWVVVASIDPTLSMEVTDDGDLEKSDTIARIDEGAVRLEFVSDVDQDGAVLTVPAGERLRLNWLLDDVPNPTMVSWVSGGAVQTGAPSDPLDLEPTSP